MQTGENTQALRKIVDMTRLFSLLILATHFYLFCYGAFQDWHLTATLIDHILMNISKLPLFRSEWLSKGAAVGLLAVSLIGAKGRKEEKINKESIIAYLCSGLMIYLLSHLCLNLQADIKTVAITYMAVTSSGYLLLLTGGTRLSRLLHISLGKDIFNKENETFPQEERLLENEYSINLPARYVYKGKLRTSWINIINPFRGTLVTGTPGSGKTAFVLRRNIIQHIQKGFSMLVYDFKQPDLTLIAYNALRTHYRNYEKPPGFYIIDLDNPKHRCNPLEPETMLDITDAMEAARTIMLGLNREWIRKQGDFFVESPINFVTAVIWYLRKYKDGLYCTWAHVIELIQADYEQLFPVLQLEPEIEVLVNPFISAFINEATDQLEGQIASAKIGLGRLASPKIYYVLTGNDFTLDINDPKAPKIVCIGNNPQKSQTYGAVLSLYISKLIKLVNRKGQLKSSLIFDEFPTIYFNNIDNLIATARSNKVATTLGIQDYSQLKKDYGPQQAEVIMNIVGNIVSGQVTGDTAKQLSERFGKINQVKESLSINSMDTSVSKSTQLDYAIPASTISTLSSGEFVGMVADEPSNKIDLKVFHNEIVNDFDAIRKEEASYQPLPKIRDVSDEEVIENYYKIKADIRELIAEELAKRTPVGKAIEKPKQAKGRKKQQDKQQKKTLSL